MMRRVRLRVRGVADQSDHCLNRNRNRNRNRFLFRLPKPAGKRHRASARGPPDGQVGKAAAFSEDLKLGPETYTYTA
ncbi:MAG: hypothetical protein ACOX52_15160 [Verrucomicrobiota bacterium]